MEQYSEEQAWITPPEDYNYRFSSLRAVFPTFKYGGIALLALIMMILIPVTLGVSDLGFIAFLILLLLLIWAFCAWRIYAHWWAWQHFGIKIDARSGVMEIIQKGNLLLWLPNSSNDTVVLAEQNVITPDKRHWWQYWPFPYDTLTIESIKYDKEQHKFVPSIKAIDYVLNADLITEIQKFVRKMPYVKSRMDAAQLAVSRDQLQVSEYQLYETRRLNHGIDDFTSKLGTPNAGPSPTPQPASDYGDIIDAEVVDEDESPSK